tara:strand:+ start:476 stop:1483 length:1008 start_codon:yes stop_codon:yes gene_type:complete
MSAWSIGIGSTTGFSQNGATAENTREWGEGPHGNRVILWKASPEADNAADGGWVTSSFSIDHTKLYRYSVWIKKTGNTNGSTYFGCYADPSPVTELNGVSKSNPYFWAGDLPKLDHWYLLVGFVHGSGDVSTTSYGRIYDGSTGKAVINMTDFKFPNNATTAKHRAYLYYNTDINNRQYFYAPRVDEVNGNEPTIVELLGILPTSPSQLTVGTDNLPSGYTLSVGGDAIMEKVKVQTESAWPDYVFNKEYQLSSLDSLQSFIYKYGHLPNIPSAQEVEDSKQDLGFIQLRLLEKIEELTLYLLQQDKKDKELEARNKVLAERIEALEKLLKTKKQ